MQKGVVEEATASTLGLQSLRPSQAGKEGTVAADGVLERDCKAAGKGLGQGVQERTARELMKRRARGVMGV